LCVVWSKLDKATWFKQTPLPDKFEFVSSPQNSKCAPVRTSLGTRLQELPGSTPVVSQYTSLARFQNRRVGSIPRGFRERQLRLMPQVQFYDKSECNRKAAQGVLGMGHFPGRRKVKETLYTQYLSIKEYLYQTVKLQSAV
jgi:hypothetical protein